MCLCLYKVIADFYFLHHQRKQFSYSAIPVPGNANAAFYLRIHLKMLPITQTREYTKIPIIATETWRHIRKDSDISSMIACLTPPKWISEASSWRFHFLGVLPRLCSSLRGIGPNLKQNICMRDWGKVIFRLFVSKLSFPSVGMGTWKLARHPFGFTPRVFGMCSLHYVLWRIFCELQENNGPLYMLSRFLASKKKKMVLQVLVIIKGPIHHGCGGSSLKCTVELQSLPTTSYHRALKIRPQLWPLVSLWHK